MDSNTVTLLCALAGSGAATALINGIFARRADKKRIDTGESQGMRWLLQDRLEHVARHYLDQGHITYEELKNWNRGHRIYQRFLINIPS